MLMPSSSLSLRPSPSNRQNFLSVVSFPVRMAVSGDSSLFLLQTAWLSPNISLSTQLTLLLHVHTFTPGNRVPAGARRERWLDLELEATVTCHTWVLETDLGSLSAQ